MNFWLLVQQLYNKVTTYTSLFLQSSAAVTTNFSLCLERIVKIGQ